MMIISSESEDKTAQAPFRLAFVIDAVLLLQRHFTHGLNYCPAKWEPIDLVMVQLATKLQQKTLTTSQQIAMGWQPAKLQTMIINP